MTTRIQKINASSLCSTRAIPIPLISTILFLHLQSMWQNADTPTITWSSLINLFRDNIYLLIVTQCPCQILWESNLIIGRQIVNCKLKGKPCTFQFAVLTERRSLFSLEPTCCCSLLVIYFCSSKLTQLSENFAVSSNCYTSDWLSNVW